MKNFYGNYKIGEDGGDQNFTKEQVDAAIAAAVTKAADEAKTSLGAKNQELLNDLKKAKDTLKTFEGIDPDKVKQMYAAFENDQDLKDISEGKHDEVIKRRMERERVNYDSKLQAASTELETLKAEKQSLSAKVTDLLINNNAVSEFVKEKGLETGVQDVVLRAKSIFKVENGEAIPRNEKGEIITGANGPMTFAEWVGRLKTEAPHLFPGSTGSNTGDSTNQHLKGIDAKIAAAAASGDQEEYRRLRAEQKAAKTGRK